MTVGLFCFKRFTFPP